MKRIILIGLLLAVGSMAMAIDGPFNPNTYSGTFRGYGNFLPGRNGVYDLGDQQNHWRKAYIDSLISSAMSLSDTLRVLSIVPYTTGTGVVGTATNAFNSFWGDSGIFGATTLYPSTASYNMVLSSGSTYNINSTAGAINWSALNNSLWQINGAGVKLFVSGTGSSIISDTISGYNGNIWDVNSWGITITGVDTLSKFYMSSFDSIKFVRVWGNIKSPSSGGSPDTLVYIDSLKTDSLKVIIAVGTTWRAPAAIGKKWPTNPGGVVNPVYCIFRKGATAAAANMQFFTSYGLAKGRVF